MSRRRRQGLGASADVHAQETQEQLVRARDRLSQARAATSCEDAITLAASAMTAAARGAQSAKHSGSDALQIQAAGVAREVGEVFLQARDLCVRQTVPPERRGGRPAPVTLPEPEAAEAPRRVGGEVPSRERLEIDGALGGCGGRTARRRRR